MALKRVTLFKSKALTEPNCQLCGLFKGCVTHKMKVSGQGRLNTLIIAEAPGKTEDERGVQLIGEAGQELRKRIKALGFDLDRDFWKINAVNCRPPKNRKPTRKELGYCAPYVKSIIDDLKPSVIILLGGTAVESFYCDDFKDITIKSWRGFQIPDRDRNAWVCPTYHPSYLIRNENDLNLHAVFNNDLKNFIELAQENRPFPVLKKQSEAIQILKDPDEIIKALKQIQKHDIVSLDYETSSLKPYDGEGLIWSAGVSCDEYAIAFPIHYPRAFPNKKVLSDVVAAFTDFLKNKNCKKVCHNLKFEDVWSKCVLGCRIAGAIACTMIDSHILRPGTKGTGLKLNAFVRFGIKGYEKEMHTFLPSSSGGYDRNNLDKMPLDKLLLYNGTDAFLTQRLFREQEKEFAKNKELAKCRKLFFAGSKALCDVQLAGIRVDIDLLRTTKEELLQKQSELHESMLSSPEVEKFKQMMGTTPDLNSTGDLRNLFYKVLKLRAEKTTKSGEKSIDAEVLHSWQEEIPLVADLLYWRKINKIVGTYITQIERETRKKRMHPFFNLHIAATGRSASSMTNFQNIPARDELAKAAIRKSITPSKGNKILEVDFGSLEVRIIACYSKCPTLVNYILDETTDMHRDTAVELFILNQFEPKVEGDDKRLRFFAKNNFVFPEFYGSYYGNCAKGLIENCFELKTSEGLVVKDHLKKKGLKSKEDFVDHVKHVEERFWERFEAVKKWQERQKKHFLKNLHTKSFFGFQGRGVLSNNDVINYPIQGTAFHCLLWCLIELNRIRIKRKWRTKIIGQIHDSIVFDMKPDEQEEVLDCVKQVMEIDLQEKHSWMNVPMKAEIEITEIDEAWYYKKEMKG